MWDLSLNFYILYFKSLNIKNIIVNEAQLFKIRIFSFFTNFQLQKSVNIFVKIVRHSVLINFVLI